MPCPCLGGSPAAEDSSGSYTTLSPARDGGAAPAAPPSAAAGAAKAGATAPLPLSPDTAPLLGGGGAAPAPPNAATPHYPPLPASSRLQASLLPLSPESDGGSDAGDALSPGALPPMPHAR